MATIDDEETTPLFQVAPSVMLVAIDDERAAVCARAAEPARALRVGHAHAAVQRMVTHMPLVIIIGSAVPEHEAESVRHQAEAIGARVLKEGELKQGDALAAQLEAAVRAAFHARSTTQGM
jgi:hypothetical protein